MNKGVYIVTATTDGYMKTVYGKYPSYSMAKAALNAVIFAHMNTETDTVEIDLSFRRNGREHLLEAFPVRSKKYIRRMTR